MAAKSEESEAVDGRFANLSLTKDTSAERTTSPQALTASNGPASPAPAHGTTPIAASQTEEPTALRQERSIQEIARQDPVGDVLSQSTPTAGGTIQDEKHPALDPQIEKVEAEKVNSDEKLAATATSRVGDEDLEGSPDIKRNWLRRRRLRRPRFRPRFRSCFASIGSCLDSVGDCCDLDDCGGCLGAGCCGVIIVCAVLTPFVCFGLYLYYLNYAKIYPGSKVAYDVFRNQSTGIAFQYFYWFTACLTSFIAAALVVAALAGLAEAGCDNCCGTCIGILLVLFILTIPYWLRFPIFNSMYEKAYQTTCNDWDVRAVINSINYSPYVWSLPSHILNITLVTNATLFTLDVFRRPLSPLIYDMVLTNDTSQFYSNITYDIENSIITSTGLNISYITTPNLDFPSLNLSLVNPGIPWTRPDYYTCWPPAINLAHQSQKVLQTVTLDPSDCSTMLVCGSAGNELKNFQTALGLAAVTHFHYSLCCTAGQNQITFGGQDPESEFGSDDSSIEVKPPIKKPLGVA
jgi:hypothetical protein